MSLMLAVRAGLTLDDFAVADRWVRYPAGHVGAYLRQAPCVSANYCNGGSWTAWHRCCPCSTTAMFADVADSGPWCGFK